MNDLFYMVDVSDNKGEWYRLHLTETHECLGGGGSPQSLLNTARRLIKKYKTITKVRNRVQTSCKVFNKKTLEVYSEDYEYNTVFEDELDEVVTVTLESVRNDNPLMRSLRKMKKTVVVKEEPPVVATPRKRPALLIKNRVKLVPLK